jgi:hypothetical protein
VATVLRADVSITEIVCVVSAVTYTSRPSGLTATPSGSVPTGIVASTLPVFVSMTEAVLASSLET